MKSRFNTRDHDNRGRGGGCTAGRGRACGGGCGSLQRAKRRPGPASTGDPSAPGRAAQAGEQRLRPNITAPHRQILHLAEISALAATAEASGPSLSCPREPLEENRPVASDDGDLWRCWWAPKPKLCAGAGYGERAPNGPTAAMAAARSWDTRLGAIL
jgi:hypothetical protein